MPWQNYLVRFLTPIRIRSWLGIDTLEIGLQPKGYTNCSSGLTQWIGFLCYFNSKDDVLERLVRYRHLICPKLVKLTRLCFGMNRLCSQYLYKCHKSGSVQCSWGREKYLNFKQDSNMSSPQKNKLFKPCHLNRIVLSGGETGNGQHKWKLNVFLLFCFTKHFSDLARLVLMCRYKCEEATVTSTTVSATKKFPQPLSHDGLLGFLSTMPIP